MSNSRTFPTSAAERYDRALTKGLKMHPVAAHVNVPQSTSHWPVENILLLEAYRDWLVSIGAAESTINQHRLPAAGHVLGLAAGPHDQLNLTSDFDHALTFVRAKNGSQSWQRNAEHSLNWFRRFLKVQRGWLVLDHATVGNADRYKEGLPDWLISQLTKLLHLRQANWRPARLAQATYGFWHRATQIWRWLFTHTEIQQPSDISRNHLFSFIDEQLQAGYKVATINHALHTFQSTLRFLQQQGFAVPHALLILPGLKKPHSLPRFLTDSQVVTLKEAFQQRIDTAQTLAAKRNALLDHAIFILLWQSGIRVGELEDLEQANIDLEAGRLRIRAAKGIADRTVYLTEGCLAAIQAYLPVRGSALTDHLFIYRHKPLSKDLVRGRLKAMGQQLGFKVTPHVLRHTFATQLLNAGASITTIQSLLGHQRLGTTMTYARVHDKMVLADYLQAMAKIEGEPAVPPPNEAAIELLNQLETQQLTAEQQQLLAELRHCLTR